MVKYIIQKRTKKQDHTKKYTVDLSKRYKFKRSSQKIKDIDISISHKIDEIKLLPYSFARDEIGTFFIEFTIFRVFSIMILFLRFLR